MLWIVIVIVELHFSYSPSMSFASKLKVRLCFVFSFMFCLLLLEILRPFCFCIILGVIVTGSTLRRWISNPNTNASGGLGKVSTPWWLLLFFSNRTLLLDMFLAFYAWGFVRINHNNGVTDKVNTTYVKITNATTNYLHTAVYLLPVQSVQVSACNFH